jgi:hypothetical protein
MSALILAVVLWAGSAIVGLGTVYGVVVLGPRDRRHETHRGLRRPAGGVMHGLNKDARGSKEVLPDE